MHSSNLYFISRLELIYFYLLLSYIDFFSETFVHIARKREKISIAKDVYVMISINRMHSSLKKVDNQMSPAFYV